MRMPCHARPAHAPPHKRTSGVEPEVLARAACGRRVGWGYRYLYQLLALALALR